MADGTIKFDTKIDDSGFKKDANSLKSLANKLMASMKKTGQDTSLIDTKQVESDMQAVQTSIEETTKKVDALKGEIATSEKSLNSWINKRAKLGDRKIQGEDLGVNKDTLSWKKLLYDIEMADRAIRDYEGDIASMNGSLAQTQSQLLSLESQMTSLEAYRSKLLQNEAVMQEYVPLSERIKSSLSTAFSSIGEKIKAMSDKSKTALESMKERLKQFISKMREAKPPTDNLTKGIFKLSNMFKLMALRMIIRAAINSMKQGFQNLVAYSSPVAQSAQMIKNSLQQLNNSLSTAFAPILTTVAPILQTLINYLSAAATAVAHFFAALTGKSTVVQAAKNQKKYSKALGGTSKAADKAQKSVAGFDTVMQLQSKDSAGSADTGGGTAPDVGSMFEEVPVNPKIKDLLDNIMNVLQPTIDAFKRLGDAMEPVKTFVAQGAIDFYNKFLKPVGTWVFGEGLPRMIDAITNGIGLIDWGKINTALANFWDALAPFAINVGEGLVWFWENAMVPLGVWVMNEAVPTFLDLLSTALDTVNQYIEIAKPAWEWLWDNWLVPVAQWTGGIIIDVLQWLNDKLKDFSDWLNANSGKIETFIKLIGLIASGWLGVQAAMGLVKTAVEILLPVIQGLATFITSPLGIVMALMAIVTWAGEGEEMINALKQAFDGILKFIKGVFKGDWQMAWDGIKNVFKGVFNGVITIAETAINLLVKALNKLSFDVPDWVPLLGGKHFGFDIKEVKLPRLATGTVIPRNAGAFAAVLGDNTREAEVVSPLSTMKQALAEALMESGYGQRDIYITLQLDNREFAKAVYRSNQNEQQRVGVRLAGVY